MQAAHAVTSLALSHLGFDLDQIAGVLVFAGRDEECDHSAMQNLPPKGDILGRPEIEVLVNRFYAAVRKDGMLGPVFDEIARVNWDEHIPKLCDFWETVLFRTGGYRGNPLEVHRHLAQGTTMDRAMFDRWVELFTATVDRNFEGENAGHIKRVAADMANVIHLRLSAGPPSPAASRYATQGRPYPKPTPVPGPTANLQENH